MAIQTNTILIRSLHSAPPTPVLVFVFVPLLQIVLMVPSTNAFSGSERVTNNMERNSKTSTPDRVLTPKYYRLVYKNVKQQKQQQQQQQQEGPTTPWDIGNCRPQPAIVRAYEEGKLRGNVLDAGCGVGENCVYLAHKYGISSVTGFDLSKDAVAIAAELANAQDSSSSLSSPFWTMPRFFAAACTEVADNHGSDLLEGLVGFGDHNGRERKDLKRFDVVVDSGLLHCLLESDTSLYVQKISRLLQPITGRFCIGCFSTANPDPWDNPRRISEDYLRNYLFSCRETWEVLSCRECWWALPPSRGSSTGGAFSQALWVEVRLLGSSR